MKSIRIYKDDIRVHILRSLFFTDAVLGVLGALIVAGLTYVFFQYGLHFFNWNVYLAATAVCEIAFLAVMTQKIDNQSVSSIVPRGIRFKLSRKKLRHKQLDQYFLDFSIQDNVILRKNSIIKICEITPFDIALLNDQDREHFFVKVKQLIHVLPFQVQLIVKKEKVKPADLSKHFFTLYDQANRKREPLIEKYVSDMSELVTAHEFLSTHHYAILSVSCNTRKPQEKINRLKKLNDMYLHMASGLSACQIDIRLLQNDELTTIARSTLR